MSNGSDSEDFEERLGPPEYLVYRVLSERYHQDNKETLRTKFHKLCCLADRKLQEEYNRDIGFPKYWYKYGRLGVEHTIDEWVKFAPNSNQREGSRAYYPADRVSESDFDHISEEVKSEIYEAVNEVVAEYGEMTGTELEQIQYENYAPNSFVSAYGKLRWHISLLKQREDPMDQASLHEFIDEPTITTFEDILNEMLVEFPKEDYEDVYEVYLTWDDTIRILFEKNAPINQIDIFLEKFIETLSETTLRFEDNQNVPEEVLQKWHSEAEGELEELKHDIERQREILLEEEGESEIEDNISESYNESMLEEINK